MGSQSAIAHTYMEKTCDSESIIELNLSGIGKMHMVSHDHAVENSPPAKIQRVPDQSRHASKIFNKDTRCPGEE